MCPAGRPTDRGHGTVVNDRRDGRYYSRHAPLSSPPGANSFSPRMHAVMNTSTTTDIGQLHSTVHAAPPPVTPHKLHSVNAIRYFVAYSNYSAPPFPHLGSRVCNKRVCMSVCPHAYPRRIHTHVQASRKFQCTLPAAVALYSSGGIVTLHVLPVLLTMSRFRSTAA